MSDFLSGMASASRARVRAARARVGEAEMLRRAGGRASPIPLRLDPSGFDVIAELKWRSPSAGPIRRRSARSVPRLGAAFARGGACAVSVVTEPTAFSGSLEALTSMERVGVLPVLRKDFLVEPYQVVEARAHGASGVLLIARLLDAALLAEMIATAAALRMFALVEAFSLGDLDRAIDGVERAPTACLLGVNARDLVTLSVDTTRHAELAARVPANIPLVAESGLATVADVSRVSAMGYRAALVGEALMRADDPEAALIRLVASGRGARLLREVER